MKVINCPCGEVVQSNDDDDLVEKIEAHMRDKHPEMAGKYTKEQILGRAQTV